jgi:ERO1-like protein alpha
VNTFLGMARGLNLKQWEDDDENCWIRSNENAKMTYVNLVLNPETRTGYSGEEAARVWRAIYNENCFKGNLQDMCMEERVFYRLISGLHMSITMKIATYYHLRDDLEATDNATTYEMFEPNYEMFNKVIAPFPDRIKNLYFIYSFTQRALQKAAPFLASYDFSTGSPSDQQDDIETEKLMKQLLSIHESCAPTFDETLMFRTEETSLLRDQMRAHFRNITSIMDCVACEKCRMWAKLEMLGLATALKIVLGDESHVHGLQRNEIIALINSFKQHSQSIADLRRFEEAELKRELAPYLSIGFSSIIGLVVLILLFKVAISPAITTRVKK